MPAAIPPGSAPTGTAPTGIAASAGTAAPGYRLRWLVLVAVLVADVMDLLDSTVVGIAAPSIQRELGGDNTVIQWVAAGYTLAFAVGLITGGRLGDLYGRRRMFLLGLTGFVALSALCGLATSPGMLIGTRVLQGLFGAVLIPQGFSLLKATFPPDEIGATFGFFGPVLALSAVGGPILAGALIGADIAGTGWRAIFLVNVPIGLACLVLAAVVLPESRAGDGVRPDPVGALLVTIGLTMLIFPLVQGRELGWPAWTLWLMAGSVPVLAGFGAHQVRRRAAGRSPLVEPGLFAVRAFSAGLAVGLAFFAAMIGLIFATGLHLQLTLRFSPLAAAVTQAPFAIGIIIGSVLSGAGLGRRHGRPVLQAGALVMVAGLVALLIAFNGAGGAVSGWQLAPGLLLCGFGAGLLVAILFDLVLSGVSLEMAGSASGVLNANQQLGNAAGVAILGTVFFGRLEAGDAQGAVAAVLWVTIGLALLTVALTCLLPRHVRAENAGDDLGAPA